MTSIARSVSRHRGFTLVELTIVLIIVALLTSGMIISFSTQKDISDTTDTQKQLAAINEALLGFAAAQQRLPCPASATSNGLEAFCPIAPTVTGACLPLPPPALQETLVLPTDGKCAVPFTGFLPAATLGISPTNANGYAIDSWGNPIRYAVTDIELVAGPNYPFTQARGIRDNWTPPPPPPPPLPPPAPNLVVCATATGITANACAAAAVTLTSNAAAVVFSTGKNGGAAPPAGNANELANWTSSNNRTFVSTTHNQGFDDVVAWVSPNLLYNRLISAGRLP